MIKEREVAVIILAGGEGTRLKPLTDIRCKPAIPFGGRYRIIDVAISNALHAGFADIYVISQFLAASLNNYLLETYSTDGFYGAHLEILSSSQETCENKKIWCKGTADAVRKNLPHLLTHPAQYFVILSGDQLYSMDLAHMLSMAKDSDADLTIATTPVNAATARRMGIMQVDASGKIRDFVEKPHEEEVLKKFATVFQHPATFLGSMGIYIFKREALVQLLQEDPREDFGQHLIPTQLKKGKAYSYIFDGYWEDIGTVASYYQANMSLTKNVTCLNLYNETKPIYTQSFSLPAARLTNTIVSNSIICEGSIISAASISHSMLGLKTEIDQGSTIQHSIFMGWSPRSNRGPITVGKNCHLNKVILDEGAYLEDDVTLTNTRNLDSYESPLLSIHEGIIVVKAGARIPQGFHI